MEPDAAPLWSSAVDAVPVIAAYAWFALSSIVLTRIDRRTHRLPDRIVLPGYAAAIGCFGVAALLGGPSARFLSAMLGMAGMFGFYLVLRLVSRSGLGGGDVKLAGVVGLHLGWLGLTPLLVGAVAAFLLGGGYATVLLLRRRATRATRIPFGPFMLVGAWIGILLGAVAGLRGG